MNNTLKGILIIFAVSIGWGCIIYVLRTIGIWPEPPFGYWFAGVGGLVVGILAGMWVHNKY